MLSRFEIVKDTLQVAVESGAPRVGRIAGLIAGAVRDITREVGGWATEVFEALDAARRADADRSGRSGRKQPAPAEDSAATTAATAEADRPTTH